jgi:hypothetical protein
MAAVKDLLVYQGDDHTWPLRLQHVDKTDPDNWIYTPFDLTEYNLVAQIRPAYADDTTTIIASLTFQVIDAANGEVNMILSSEDAKKLAGRYRWDCQIVRIMDDYITTLLFGAVKSQKEVTRDG